MMMKEKRAQNKVDTPSVTRFFEHVPKVPGPNVSLCLNYIFSCPSSTIFIIFSSSG